MSEFIAILITGIISSVIPKACDNLSLHININSKIFTILLWIFCVPSLCLIFLGLIYYNIFMVIFGIAIYIFLSVSAN